MAGSNKTENLYNYCHLILYQLQMIKQVFKQLNFKQIIKSGYYLIETKQKEQIRFKLVSNLKDYVNSKQYDLQNLNELQQKQQEYLNNSDQQMKNQDIIQLQKHMTYILQLTKNQTKVSNQNLAVFKNSIQLFNKIQINQFNQYILPLQLEVSHNSKRINQLCAKLRVKFDQENFKKQILAQQSYYLMNFQTLKKDQANLKILIKLLTVNRLYSKDFEQILLNYVQSEQELYEMNLIIYGIYLIQNKTLDESKVIMLQVFQDREQWKIYGYDSSYREFLQQLRDLKYNYQLDSNKQFQNLVYEIVAFLSNKPQEKQLSTRQLSSLLQEINFTDQQVLFEILQKNIEKLKSISSSLIDLASMHNYINYIKQLNQISQTEYVEHIQQIKNQQFNQLHKLITSSSNKSLLNDKQIQIIFQTFHQIQKEQQYKEQVIQLQANVIDLLVEDLKQENILINFYTFSNMVRFQIIDDILFQNLQIKLSKEIYQMDLNNLSILSLSLKQIADNKQTYKINQSLIDNYCECFQQQLMIYLKTEILNQRLQKNIQNITYCLFRFCENINKEIFKNFVFQFQEFINRNSEKFQIEIYYKIMINMVQFKIYFSDETISTFFNSRHIMKLLEYDVLKFSMYFYTVYNERPFLYKGENFMLIKKQMYLKLIIYQKQIVQTINDNLINHRLDCNQEIKNLIDFIFLNEKYQFELTKCQHLTQILFLNYSQIFSHLEPQTKCKLLISFQSNWLSINSIPYHSYLINNLNQFRTTHIIQIIYYLGIQQQLSLSLTNTLLSKVIPYLNTLGTTDCLHLLYAVSQVKQVDQINHLQSHLKPLLSHLLTKEYSLKDNTMLIKIRDKIQDIQ